MTSQLSRIQIVDAPPAAPGHCAICGTTQGPMVDFGMNMEFYGVIYFCVESCLVELANSFDYHSPRQWKMIMNQVEDQRRELQELRDQNEKMSHALGIFDSIKSIDPSAELDISVVLQEPEPEPSNDSDQLTFDFSEGEDRSDESDDEWRSANVQRDDSIDSFFDSI